MMIIRRIVGVFVRVFLRLRFKIKITNVLRMEKIKTGCIIAPNHISNWEPVVIPAFTKKVVYIMAKAELFKNKFVGGFLGAFKAYPIKRGKNDVEAMKTTVTLLGAGKCVCIFPEGKRNKNRESLRFKPGVIMLACKAKVPIIPVGVDCEFNKLRPVFRITYGEPIYFDEYYDRQLSREELNFCIGEVQSKVEDLLLG